MKGLASRRLALEILLKVEVEKAYAKLALDAAFKRRVLSERDRAFVTYLVQGTLRHLSELDATLAKVSSRPLESLPAALRNTLRLSVFQLLHSKDIPEFAVINTAAQLAKDTGHQGSARFVNGLLRALLKSKVESQEATATDSTEAKAESFSLPSWLVERWQARYGNEEALELMKFSQKIPELTLRCCQLSINPDGLLNIFESKGMTVQQGELVTSCFTILDRGKQTGPIEKLPGFTEGLFTIQDEAAALVAHVVDPKAGNTILDLCAAPGGKSLHLAELLENKGRIVAVDIHGKRLQMLGRERQRLGLTNIETLEADGRSLKTDFLADLILIDAPCSGTGVINRRSDLRHRRQEPDIDNLVQIQRDLLANAVHLLKKSGSIIYSTCSMEPEENFQNIKWFLDRHPQFHPESLARFIPQSVISRWSKSANWQETQSQLESGLFQLLPTRHGYSGFFICRLTCS